MELHRQADGEVDRHERLAFVCVRARHRERVPMVRAEFLRYLRREYLERVGEHAGGESAYDPLLRKFLACYVYAAGDGVSRLVGVRLRVICLRWRRPREVSECGPIGAAFLPCSLQSFTYPIHRPLS